MRKSAKRLASFFLAFAMAFTMMPMTLQAEEKAAYNPDVVIYTEVYSHEAEAREVLRLVNEERAKAGIAPLTMSSELEAVAQMRAVELTALFDHTRPDGTVCFSAAGDFGLGYTSIAENIAAGQPDAASVMNSWVNSPGHYGNIMDPDLTHIGIGCIQYGYTKYWVQFFMTPDSKTNLTQAPAAGEDDVYSPAYYLLDFDYVSGCQVMLDEPEISLELGGDTAPFDIQVFGPGLTGGGLYLGPVYDMNANKVQVTVSGNQSAGVFTDGESLFFATEDTGSTGKSVVTITFGGGLTVTKTINVTCSHPADKQVTETTKEATCVENGLSVTKCGVCGYEISSKELPMSGHDFQWTTTKEPTCTETGTKKGICRNCQAEKTETIPATGHTETEVVEKEPTCTETGLKSFVCSVCGEETRKPETIPAAGHTYGDWTTVTEPTWETEGLETRECTVCGHVEENVIPALSNGHEHDFTGAETIITPATCTTDGLKEVACSNELCSAKQEVVIPATGHDWSDWHVDVAATWDTEGSQSRACANCGETETKVIPTLESTHVCDFSGEETIIKEPTCTEAGLKEVQCSTPECGKIQEVEIPALGHTPTEWETVKEATCTEEGKAVQFCQVCEEQIGEKVLPKTEHNYGEWEVLKQATATEEGERQRVCEDCGYVYKDVIPKLVIQDVPEGDTAVSGGQIGDAVSDTSGSGSEVVETGDNSNPAAYAVIAIGAMAVVCGAAVARRRSGR